jgi:hypothetical protein
VLFLIRTNI